MPSTVAESPSVARQAANRVASLVDQEYAQGPSVNVGQAERWASLLGGGALALFGLSRDNLAGYGLAALGGMLVYRGLSGHCSAYSALGIDTAHRGQNPNTSIRSGQGIKFDDSVTINKPAAELYRFWRHFENLPRVMRHLKSITVDGNKSHWVAKGPLGYSAEWDAEIHTERENELIGWRSLPGSTVATAGSVHFRELPGGHGTEIHIVMKYDPPAGKVGVLLANLFGRSAEHDVAEDLRNFKAMMEAGELPTTEGQPRGTC